MKQTYEVIKKREKVGQTNRVDLLQLMLESASDDEFIQVCFSLTIDSQLSEIDGHI